MTAAASLRPKPLPATFSSVIIAVVLAPHAGRLPVLIILFTLALMLWRYIIDRTGRRLPSGLLRLLLLLAAIAIVYTNFGTVLGRDSGIAFLAVLAGLKLLEMSTQRDLFTMSLLNYFLVITQFLYTQSLFTAAYMLVAVVLITTSLINLHQEAKPGNTAVNLRLASKLLIQAAPIAIVMFLFFPRIPGPLWGLPSDAFSGKTGLSETMAPGHISQLVHSNDIAFRVHFEGDIPPPTLRYWRGPILWNTDGEVWASNDSINNGFYKSPNRLQLATSPIRYRVTLEPHYKRWLFALDLPATAPPQGYMTMDFQLRSGAPIKERISYETTSFLKYKTGAISYGEYRLATAFPTKTHPRLQRLAQEWRQQYPQDWDIITQALRYYQQQKFVYTLNPPRLGNDPMDQFLFETRKGFCEHFAASFVLLMRAAGIPARVVTGYQGGELNPVGQYLIVRQRDAHAWAEVWLEADGWVRVDPTAVIAPQRVEFGIDTSFDEMGLPARFAAEGNNALGTFWRQAAFAWDAVNNTWNQWILGYDDMKQQRFFSFLKIGDFSWSMIGILLSFVVGTLVAIIAWLTLRMPPLLIDPIEKEWRKLCRKLAIAGIKRHDWEGPQDFLARISQTHPELATMLAPLVEAYISLRFQKTPDISLLPKFRQDVKNFRP